jgi:UDP-glucose 4-epimerase
MAGRRVVIVGVASHWGVELARRLERDPSVDYLAGIDIEPPPADLERTDFIEADVRTPLLSRLLPATEADTIVHCGILWYPAAGRPARALHDVNVIGTLQLLAACERTPTLERLIVRGSAAIYGCEGATPQFFTEDMARTLPLRTRFQRDVSELEAYVENFARRHPALTCCTLRCQPEIGPELDTPLVRYLGLPAVPTQLGWDPRLQFLHAEDAHGALEAATRDPVRGPVNVAPSGSISLSHVLRLVRRPAVPVPHPLFTVALERLGKRLGAGPLYGDGVRLLRFGRGVDNHRLRTEIGYQPRFDAEGAIRDFAAKSAGRRIGPPLHPGDLAGRLSGAVR